MRKTVFGMKILCLFSVLGTIGCGKEPVPGPKGEPGLTPFIGDNGNWWIGESDTEVKATGDKGDTGTSISSVELISSYQNVDTYRISFSNGEHFDYTVSNGVKGDTGDKGADGCSVLTGYGLPLPNQGKNGDSYINLNDWNYYVCENGNWVEKGNLKGIKGDTGVSIIDTYLDDYGNLVVKLSSGDEINVGKIKETATYTVDFYCGDLLVDSRQVTHGDKVVPPELDDFVVKHWYIDKDFEHEWLWYGCVVTENMTLYGDYVPVIKTVTYNSNDSIQTDDYGYGNAIKDEKEICVSKATPSSDGLTTLDDRGILFNKNEIGSIDEIKIDIDNRDFSEAKIYYGSNPLSFDYSEELNAGLNQLSLQNFEFFTIQNSGANPITIKSLEISYSKSTSTNNNSLPTVIIETDNNQPITSRTEYINCKVSTQGGEKDVNNLGAQIKIRGNSTSSCPKKPYRIKLNKKNSLFGYEKAKNWVLLADYMDGSNMHNYTALSFARMVKNNNSFCVKPIHVNVILNGEDIGLYEFAEHIEAKEGRLNIEQDNIWEKDFDNINFYVERESKAETDPEEIEGETYFKVPLTGYEFDKYVFALKYPEKEDFEEELDDGSIVFHEDEFDSFFNSLKEYITDISYKFVDYYNDNSKFSLVDSVVDVNSLAEYAVVDQVFSEMDHALYSFKMYRKDGGKLQFGPNWDYDSRIFWLPYTGSYVKNPFEVGSTTFYSTYFNETWGRTLFNDGVNGRPLFKNIWDKFSGEDINAFLNSQKYEMDYISSYSIYDCNKWMNNEYFALFDNTLYFDEYLKTQMAFLKNYYQ